MKYHLLMILGSGSDVGKSIITAGLRLAVRRREENQRLLQALEQLLIEERP